GANTGIGQGIAVALAAAGAEVVLVGRSPMDETEALIAAIKGVSHSLQADLGVTGTVASVLEAAWQRFGAIDVLVNNAGIIRRADAADFTEADWDAVMDVNLKSVFLLTQAFARRVFAEGRKG